MSEPITFTSPTEMAALIVAGVRSRGYAFEEACEVVAKAIETRDNARDGADDIR